MRIGHIVQAGQQGQVFANPPVHAQIQQTVARQRVASIESQVVVFPVAGQLQFTKHTDIAQALADPCVDDIFSHTHQAQVI